MTDDAYIYTFDYNHDCCYLAPPSASLVEG